MLRTILLAKACIAGEDQKDRMDERKELCKVEPLS
jgi:hypothetical protein